jgi:hypothetical protein
MQGIVNAKLRQRELCIEKRRSRQAVLRWGLRFGDCWAIKLHLAYLFPAAPPVPFIIVAIVHFQLLSYKTSGESSEQCTCNCFAHTCAARTEDPLVPSEFGQQLALVSQQQTNLPLIRFVVLVLQLFRNRFFVPRHCQLYRYRQLSSSSL